MWSSSSLLLLLSDSMCLVLQEIRCSRSVRVRSMRTLPEVCLPGREEWVEVVQEEERGFFAQRRVQQGLWSLWGTAAHQRVL